jgi:hypothetical protein
MKFTKNSKRLLAYVLGISLLFFAILIFHIASFKQLDNATVQISRIDFKNDLDSLSANLIKKQMHLIAGVKQEIIIKKNVLVYFHDNKLADSKTIFNQLMQKGNYEAKRFEVPAEMMGKKVCPIMSSNSLSYKFSNLVKQILN